MNEYETMIILHPDLGEAGTKEMVERVRTILTSGNAEIANLDEWGMRELAYTIQKQRRGYYVLAEYKAQPQAVSELERQLKLSDQAIRFLTVRKVHRKTLPPRPPRPESGSDDGVDDMA